MNANVEPTYETSGLITVALAIVAVVGIAGVGFAWYDYNTVVANQQAYSAQAKTEQLENAQKIAALDKRLTDQDASNAAAQSDLGVVTRRLRLTEGELQQARTEAAKTRQDNQQTIANLDTNVKTQLATKASTDDLNTVSGTVTVVKSELDNTKNDLKMARSELGTLIASNHDEVDVLRRSGERDYVEFTITGRNKPQRIGNISAQLRSVDIKKNKFTVALMVDDLNTEKKDRTVNEPIVFYENGSHQADEFVVNSVSKDKISATSVCRRTPGAPPRRCRRATEAFSVP
jgi:hypothetical protein